MDDDKQPDTQFDTQPGRNGGTLKRGSNPKPKGAISLTTRLVKALKAKDPESNRAQADLLADDIIRHARGGNAAYAKLIYDRVEGPVTQKLEINVEDIPDDRLIAILNQQAGSRSET